MVLVGLIVSLAAGAHCQTWRHGLSDVFYCFIWFLPYLFWGCVICGVLFCSRREEGFLFFLHALGGHHMAAEHCGLAQDMMGYMCLLWSLLPVTWGPGKIPKGTTPVTFFLQLGQPPKVFRTSQNSATCWESSEQPAKTFSVQSTVERTGWYVKKKGGVHFQALLI